MHPSWSSRRNSVHEAVENLHSVFAFPSRDHDSSSFLDFSHIFSFFISNDNFFPFKLIPNSNSIEFNLLLPSIKIFITSSYSSFHKFQLKNLLNASTHRFSITFLALFQSDTYLPDIIFASFSNFASFTLVQITKKNIENSWAEDRKRASTGR